jgi:hypothetical protein
MLRRPRVHYCNISLGAEQLHEGQHVTDLLALTAHVTTVTIAKMLLHVFDLHSGKIQ